VTRVVVVAPGDEFVGLSDPQLRIPKAATIKPERKPADADGAALNFMRPRSHRSMTAGAANREEEYLSRESILVICSIADSD